MTRTTTQPEQEAAQQVANPQTSALVVTARSVGVLQHDLEERMADLSVSLAGRYPPDYFAKVALQQFRRTPDLLADVAATPVGRASFLNAVMQAADVGLPFIMGRAYLVPFRDAGTPAVQLIIGYQGLVDLMTAPGTGLTFAEAAVVYEGDDFDYRRGTGGYLHHRERWGPQRGNRMAVWARVVFANGQEKYDVMDWSEVEVIRQRAPSARARSSPWLTDPDEMGKKTVLRRLSKTQRVALPAMAVLDDEDDFEYRRGMAASPLNPAAADPQTRLRQTVQARVNAVAEPPVTSPSTPPADAVDDQPAPAQTVDSAPTQTDQCGATVLAADNAYVVCTLRPGHRGRHSDGTQDWE